MQYKVIYKNNKNKNNNMKYLDYIFMGLGFLTALGGMILAIMDNQNWHWQFCTMSWVAVAFFNRLTIHKLEKEK
jgi:hypothetical protein